MGVRSRVAGVNGLDEVAGFPEAPVRTPLIPATALVRRRVFDDVRFTRATPATPTARRPTSSALVVIAARVGGSLLGITGALLAVPVTAVALLILREVAQPRLDAG